jgi:hypothetical protein
MQLTTSQIATSEVANPFLNTQRENYNHRELLQIKHIYIYMLQPSRHPPPGLGRFAPPLWGWDEDPSPLWDVGAVGQQFGKETTNLNNE